ncbi:MAG: DNA primase [Bacteroidota bacterium]
MIPQTTVQEILETAKIEEVVGDFVNLKRRGVNLIGLCPFHNEKTPSFTVSPTKNICKCFGCGKGGPPVQFLMDHENFTFPEALRYLAKKYNIEIVEKELSPEARQAIMHQDSLYIVNQFAERFYKEQLQTAIGKSVGLSYFKERGFRETTVEKFGLGYAVAQKDALTSKAVSEGYNIELLRQLGLTTKFDSDFFRDRVMFTIHNLSGKPIAFAGRTLKKDKKIPKYINSPETEIYVKSKVLYGAYFAKQAIRKQDECILVEGYTDVISLHQAGIENVVASSGTSLTVGQINLIKRYSPNIKILYDGDAAGIKAALRGLDLVLEQDMNVKVVLLPEGEDPDSYVQNLGSTAFREFIKEKAQDFIFFKTSLLIEEAAGDPIKKTLLIKDIVSSIARIPDPIKRSLYVKECAGLMEIEEKLLVAEVNRAMGGRAKRQKIKREVDARRPASVLRPVSDEEASGGEIAPSDSKSQSGDEFQEQDIVRIIVTLGHHIFDEEEQLSVAEYILSNLEDILDQFDNALYKKTIDAAFNELINERPVNHNFFLNHESEDIRKLSLNLMSSPHEYSPGWDEREIFLRTQKIPEENFTRDSIQSLKRFKLRKITRMCKENQEKLKTEKDVEELIHLLQIQQKLMDVRNVLAEELNTVVL